MAPFTLHLLRHGEPERPGRLMGRTDCPSSAAGIQDCIDRAMALEVEAIVCSNLSRAQAAAEEIGHRKGLAVTIDPLWRELDFGAWDGLAPEEIDPAALARFQANPDANPPPDGEPWSQLVARVGRALDRLSPRDTLIVTHGGAMRAALAHLCDLRERNTWAVALPYAALLTLEVWLSDPLSAQITGLRT
ncbi:histidine phosphatase family protein [Novosphingobium sp. G106]|uniref:histidine phosphatase family protein n=1 Tax=Novosphingobium sp. G106 TaxID=2849500 RepID=UPI001C2DD3C9|nr:histidine phosphatase family protein [Novosphingobium sp. G106]MBV1687454.1 histidine phosphatase family protein [Novosphingobium sp. G106]